MSAKLNRLCSFYLNVLIFFINFAESNTDIMPNTKSSDIRYKVLDRCLRRGGYSTAKLMETVSEELEFNGYEPVTALNTIRNDLRYIESTYPQVHIVVNKSGRNKTYAYENPDSSIYKLQFSDDELGQLSQCMAILSHFEGMPQMEWLQAFMERFKLSLNIDPNGKRVVGFDENKYLVGREHFSRLLSAISNKEVLAITYKNFKNNESKRIVIHPYYLKEYNNRWFLIAKTHNREGISTFAFDRIENVESLKEVEYIENKEYDFNDDYFTDMVGVSRPVGESLSCVELWVSPNLTPYIITKPIHESQKIKSKDESGTIIQLNLYVNYELKQLLLSYGEGIKVLSPINLSEEIQRRLSESLNLYKIVQND